MRPYIVGRQIHNVAGMPYAPTCEQGVVFLFGRLAPNLGFTVEKVQVRYPDCFARYRGKLRRIEFEFRASHFAVHDPKGADIIVCWENDWAARPARFRHLEIIDLKRHVRAEPRILVVAHSGNEDNQALLDNHDEIEWNVPLITQVDDLVLMYRTQAGIADLWKVVGPFKEFGKRNQEGRYPGLQTGLKLITRLAQPVTFEDFKKHRLTCGIPVVKRRFQGKGDVTDDWPAIYDLLVKKNLSLKRKLKDYIPE